jgi:hypothetical protein
MKIKSQQDKRPLSDVDYNSDISIKRYHDALALGEKIAWDIWEAAEEGGYDKEDLLSVIYDTIKNIEEIGLLEAVTLDKQAQGSIDYISSVYNSMIQKSEMLAVYAQNALNATPGDPLATTVLALVDDIDKINEWVSQGLPLHTQVQEQPGAWKAVSSLLRRLSFVIDSI